MEKGFKSLLALSLVALLGACSQDVKFDLPQTQQSFGQQVTYNNKVDILWIVDTSTSMDKYQAKLSAEIPSLVSALNAIKMDYHIATVTTSVGGTVADGGRFIGTPKYLTSKSSDLTQALRSRLVLGSNGSNRERGLESMATVLSADYLAGEGLGFFRKDALLVVVALSNEDDKTAISNPGSYFSSFLDSVKPPFEDGSRAWVFNFIGVLPSTTNCDTRDGYVEVGYDFIDLVNRSGGVQASICDNSLAKAVVDVRARVTQILTDFKLSKKPDVSTIKVVVNSELVPRSSTNGWDYIESLNVIRFYGSAVPAADASINIDFKPKEAN